MQCSCGQKSVSEVESVYMIVMIRSKEFLLGNAEIAKRDQASRVSPASCTLLPRSGCEEIQYHRLPEAASNYNPRPCDDIAVQLLHESGGVREQNNPIVDKKRTEKVSYQMWHS